LMEYSGEKFDTGNPDIDNYFDDIDPKTTNISTLTQLANTDVAASNLFFEQEGDDLLDFSEIDPFSENIVIQD
jgi:hypothetical protein